MLVHSPQFIQLPEGIVPEGIPSEVRLQRVDHCCYCGWKQLDPVLVGCVPFLEYRELNSPFFGSGKFPARPDMGQSPCQLIERRSQAADEIPEYSGDNLGKGGNFDLKNMHLLLKICALADGATLRVMKPFVEFGLKRIEVYLRPVGFHLNIGENSPRWNEHEQISFHSGDLTAGPDAAEAYRHEGRLRQAIRSVK